MQAAAEIEARAGQLDAVAALVRRRTEVELELRAELVSLYESTRCTEQRFVADELAIVLAESPRSAQTMLDTALCQSSQPRVKALVENGTWSTRHGDAVMDELDGLTEDQVELVLDLVLRQRSARTPHELRKATRAGIYVVDPEAAEKAAERAKKDRAVTQHDERNGSASLVMTGSKGAIALAMAGLDALALKAGPEDDRTLLQRRFDTMMLLVTGQITAAGAQVQLLVDLATVQGGDAPAEIPGLGLITAGEARELVEGAESIRRVVTDAAGQLVSIDGTVEKVVVQPQAAVEATVLLTDELEPEPLTEQTDADHLAPSLSDEQWLAQVQDAICDPQTAQRLAAQELYDHSHPCPGPVETPEQLAAQVQLRALLVVLQEQETLNGRPVGSAHVKIEPDGSMRVHYTDDPQDPDPGGGGGTGPPTGPTQPLPAGYVDDRLATRESAAGPDLLVDPHEAARQTYRQWLSRTLPSWATEILPPPEPEPSWPAPRQGDGDWFDAHPDRTLAHAVLEAEVPLTRRAEAPPGGWPRRPDPRKAWGSAQLDSALTSLIARPVNPLPPDSSSYPFRGPLARHLKMRDQTCRFPGCPRLAAHCDCDHRVPWPAGPTSVINGVSECEHHHQCKHAIMTLDRLADGTLRWTLPTGHSADSPPRPILRGW